MPSEAEGQPSASSGDEKTSNLWNLLPSFDPSTDNAKEYGDKVRFLWGICPPKDRGMLAPRLALLCKGTAWSQVRAISSEKLTNPDLGYKALLKALETWEDSEELQTYEKFERAFYRVVQKGDESALSFVNRINVAFEEVGGETTVRQVRAFVMLRQSALGSEDKKRVVAMAGGYEPEKVEAAMRSLSTKVLGAGDTVKKKIYPANLVEDDTEETNFMAEEEMEEDQVLAVLLEEGDETALLIQEFEDQVIHVCQDAPELAMAFSTYQEARQKLREKARSRGFWPVKGSKGKGKVKKKGKGGRRYQSLAERIAGSTCRICGMRGHWKDECPQRDRASNTADANVILSEEPEISAEVMDTLPDGVFGNWQVGSFQNSGRHYQSCWGPPESPSDNEEFSEFCSHDLILHVDGFPKGKDPLHQQGQSRFPNFKKNFRRACETCFGVNGRSPEQSEKFRQPLLGDQGTGIIDTGASKSVIGEKRVNALLSTLKSIHRESVKWQESETVFRFGNNGCLKSVGALFIPFGKRWMKVEVVQGMTPFLLSNSFLHALGADVMVSRSSLRVAGWRSEVKLQRNAKGLFTVRLTDLIEAASLNTNSVETEEVITLASSCNQSQNRGVYCQQQQHQHQQPKVQTSTTSAATSFAAVAQLQVQSRSKSCVDQGVNVAQRCHGDAQHQDDGSSRPFSRSGIHGLGCSPGWRGRSELGVRASSDAGDQDKKAPRGDDSARMGAVDLSRGQMKEAHLLPDLHGGQCLREVHEGTQEVGVTLGTELPVLCRGNAKDGRGVLGELLPGVCSPMDEHHECSRGSDRAEGTGVGAAGGCQPNKWQEFQGESEAPHGIRGEQNEHRCGEHGREADPHGDSSTRAGQDQAGDEPRLSTAKVEPPVVSASALSDELIAKIEVSMNAIEAELTQLKAMWPTCGKPEKRSPFKLDLLEIYCDEDSQITEQTQKLGLKARRFTFADGDLSTYEGRSALWKILEEERPREVWMAPECKYWGNYSRRNMGRGNSTANKILVGRDQQRVHLRLCNDVYWFQMGNGGHFHLEQPQGSEAIYQPEMKDVLFGTLCTTFDMCEVGKLLAPHVMKRTYGNNFQRKRTNVYTSSRIFHEAFDHRMCPGHHQHVPIAGKIRHLGRWISLSEYAARYTTGFGRNVARYVACRFLERPLIWDELLVDGGSDVFVEEVVQKKRAAAESSSAEPDSSNAAKRLRYGGKQTPMGDHECATGEYWDGIFKKIEPMVPRVGKWVLENENILSQIQKGAPQLKIQRVEACRGTERLRVPSPDIDPALVPMRLTVIKDRASGKALVLGPAEEWSTLPKRQQIRKGKPARVSLTIFGHRKSETDDVGAPDGVVSDEEQKGELDVGILGHAPPKNVPVHGPGFRDLSKDEQAQIRRLHHNLGHPSPLKLANFLKERHSDSALVQGALDFQCDSCAETKSGPDVSRPATIHENLGFNQVVGMDTATWTSQAGKRFQFSHIIDEGTLFHVGAPVISADAESQVRIFERHWMLWAGPPQTIYVDPGTEYTAGTWQDRMQSLDVHVKVSASEAHWQLGRVEIHGSIVKKMLSRMDLEKPIQTSVEFERALTQAFNAKNSLSRVKGYSPEQAVLGAARHLPGSVVSSQGLSSLTLAEGNGPESEAFRENLERRSCARRAFIDADNSSSLRRALLRRTRPVRGPYEVGDLVLYWRRKGANMRRDRGRWYGPASVVAIEGTRNVWMNHAGKLVRASPEQLRPASFREWKLARELELESGVEKKVFQQPLRDGGFVDLEEEGIPDADGESEPYEPSVGEPEGEVSVPQSNASPQEEIASEIPLSEEEPDYVRVPVPADSSASEMDSPKNASEHDTADLILFGDDVNFDLGDGPNQLWELEIPVEAHEEMALFTTGTADESVLLVSNAKKKRVEVRLSDLSSADQLRMAVAKHKELGAWLKHSTVKKVSQGKIPPEAIMRCRWLLTWKAASSDDAPEE